MSTVTKYTAMITTSDPSTGIVGFVTKGDAQERRSLTVTTPIAFRWPQVGETWMVRQENGTWFIDSPLPPSGYSTVAPGDAIINSPTGTVHVLGSSDGSTDFTFSKVAGGDLSGTYPNPTVRKINGVTVPLTGSAWIVPTLLNSWVQVGGRTPRYLKDSLGFVHLQGNASGGASNTIMFMLPPGYRPGIFSSFVSQGPTQATPGATNIDTGGNVIGFPQTTGNVNALDGITFLAEN